MGRLPVLVYLGLTFWCTALAAQAVRGSLVDTGSGQPIDGAFVALLDSGGVEVSRALTGTGGTFLLRASAPGTYRLRFKRIGFRPSETPPFALEDGQTVGYRLEVDAVPVRLPAVTVEGRPQCGTRGAAGAEVAQLWEEAREALAAVKWTEDQRQLRYTVERFERQFPRAGREVLAERHMTWSGTGARPFQSIPAEQLAVHGFVVPGPGDIVDYYGPDADVLLGDVFLRTHCFSARDGGAERPDLVGLAFEPAPSIKLPDVVGVLWLEEQTSNLRSLEFKYTVPRDGSLGGRVEFTPLPSGAWIVKHWWIRTARVDTAGRGRPYGRRRLPRLLGFRETGGIVSTISSPTGKVLYSGTPTIVEGNVVDSSRSGGPLSGAIVVVKGTDRADTTDNRGRFRIAGSLDGNYRLLFQHPRLDSLGIDPDERPMNLVRGARETLTLFVPPEPVVIGRLCPDGLAEDRWIIVGLVRDSALRAVPDARLHLQVAGRARQEAGATDRTGRFVICQVGAGEVTLSADAGRGGSGEVVLEFKDGGVWRNRTEFHALTGRIWTQDISLWR